MGFEECGGALCEKTGTGTEMHVWPDGHGRLSTRCVLCVPSTTDDLLHATALSFSTVPQAAIAITSHK